MWTIVIVVGYLLGSVDFAVVVARSRGVDIYQVGSGNPGATNVLRALGKKAAALVMIGDLLKGVVAAAMGELVVGSELAGYLAGLAAVVGHCFPVWHRFKGGKGVATAGGMILWLEPLVLLPTALVWVVVFRISKISSVASLTVAVLLVPGLAVAGVRGWPLVAAGAAALLVLVRHRANISRLLNRQEHTVGPT